MSRIWKISYAALAFTMVVAGCAEERPPRSFVQPNVLKKSDLQGTWYYIQTVTDAPPTSSFMFVGNSSELMKIKFDVEEDYLYARRAYEQIIHSEDAYQQDPAKYEGQPVAAWRISTQFDIIRDYNATTGEESNKIIESTERPWNEREFVRVDWSQNLVTDYVGLGINFFFEDGASVQPSSYWESDPTKPDALHLERADETDAPEFDTGEANYLDITNKWLVTPTQQTVCFEENGQTGCFTIPACFLSYKTDDCASQVVKVRHSFAKISPRHDYQPRNWDGKQMNLFGIWDVGLNRLTYNRQYGVTNSGFIRHAARFNLWKQSYFEDKVTPIPYAERELRTIPYYAESSLEPFPPELFDSGKEVIRQWNDAVSVAAQDVMGKMPDKPIFVWCHNPVKLAEDSMGPADDSACVGNLKPTRDAKGNVVKDDAGNPIYRARQGDPRRSTIFWVNQEQNAGPLGYGPPLFDVETGETISGQAYIYGAALDTYAAYSRDLTLLVTGKLSADTFINGTNVDKWVSANREGTNDQPKTHTAEDIKVTANAMNFGFARGQAPQAPINTSSLPAFIQSIKQREDAMYKTGLFGSSNADLAQVRRDKLKGTTLEAMMVTPDVMAMGGAAVGTDWTALSDAEKSRVSPLRSTAVRKAIEDRMDKMRVFGYDFADFADEGVAQRAIALAKDPAIPNMDPEAIRQKLRRDIFLGVTLHEVGHNMGLRHNFRASFDSLNYFPNYWQLRKQGLQAGMSGRFDGVTKSGQVKSKAYAGGAACTDPAHAGKLRPRYIDCPGGATSVAEAMGGIREYQYSSIMDYGANFNSDLVGLGKYDKAAMKFSYAGDGFVEVFTNVKTSDNERMIFESLEYFQNAFGFPQPLTLDGFGTTTMAANLTSINYYNMPDLFEQGVDGIEMREDVPYADIRRGGKYGELLSDGLQRPMVPYFFCSDEFVGNLTCQRFDSGADAFEQSQDLIQRYENYYLVNNFKRDRYTFHTSMGYMNRISGRYFDMLREQLTWYTLLRADFTDFVPQGSNFWSSEDGWGGFTQAVADGFDMLGRVISRPDIGGFDLVSADKSTDYPIDYYKNVGSSTDPTYPFYSPTVKIVNMLDGKFVDTTWDFDNCGYYWADECQTRIGYFLDKTVALDVLTQSQAYFTGRDTSTDVRRYAIGYILPFKAQLQEKFGALLSGDYTSLAPTVAADGTFQPPRWTVNDDGRDNTGAVTRQNMIDPSTGFSLQVYAGVYGLSSFPTTFDHSFIETTKIFVVGNGEAAVPDSELLANADKCPTPPAACPDPVLAGVATFEPSHLVGASIPAVGNAKEWLLWTDKDTGKTYAAHAVAQVGDGEVNPNGVAGAQGYRNDSGVRMLQTLVGLGKLIDANPAAPNLTQAKALFIQNIEVMRSLHAAFGYGVYKSDAPFIY